ncbi:MAG TPA: protein translocase subunit SecF [Firmicutes bacterium]|nr:protein translocase subunit SecF [Bacillota bacterium]
MNFLRFRRQAFILSGVLAALSIVFLFVPGLNLGVDFTGGTILERQVEKAVSTSRVRDVLDESVPEVDLSGATVQILDSPNQFVVRTRQLDNTEIMQIDEAFNKEFGNLVVLRTDVVGPVIGRELIQKALLAVVLASFGILLYITFRFEYRFATVAVVALLHDVLLVIGFFALTQREVNSPFVAAVLTVLGYSINDTIVIFDRIRENLRFRRRESYAEIVNTSLKQSLSRTLNTSVTTFIVVFMLVLFGGSAIRDFALALLLGIVIGTYSSLMLAGPLWETWVRKSQ